MRTPSHAGGIDITAFILSFFVPLIGFVLGIVGVREAHKYGRKASGLAIAAIVISSTIVLTALGVAAGVGVAASNSPPQETFQQCMATPGTQNCDQYINNNNN